MPSPINALPVNKMLTVVAAGKLSQVALFMHKAYVHVVEGEPKF